MSNRSCWICGKPTRSHDIGKGLYVCHSCYTDEEHKEKIQEKEREHKLNEINNLINTLETMQARRKLAEKLEEKRRELNPFFPD